MAGGSLAHAARGAGDDDHLARDVVSHVVSPSGVTGRVNAFCFF
jgi:hypothetical protein